MYSLPEGQFEGDALILLEEFWNVLSKNFCNFLLSPYGDSKSRSLVFLFFSGIVSAFHGFCWKGMFIREGTEGSSLSSPPFRASWKFGLWSAGGSVVRLSFWPQSAGVLDGTLATVCGEADGDTQTCLTRSLALCRSPPPPPFLLSCHLRVSF